MFFVLETNCRPADAAYLVAANSFAVTSAHPGCDYVAVVSAPGAPTVAWYKWGLNRRLNWAVELVGELHAGSYNFGRYKDRAFLAKSLNNWFN